MHGACQPAGAGMQMWRTRHIFECLLVKCDSLAVKECHCHDKRMFCERISWLWLCHCPGGQPLPPKYLFQAIIALFKYCYFRKKQSQQCKRQWLLLVDAWRGFTYKFRVFANLSSDFCTTLTSTRVSPVLRNWELARSSDCREMPTLVFVIWQKFVFHIHFFLFWKTRSCVCGWIIPYTHLMISFSIQQKKNYVSCCHVG